VTHAAILGCAGLTLSKAEKAFFRDAAPWGFILFARNVESPDQVRGLVAELRETVGRGDAPVLIDQEGGRVARLKPPHWKPYPPGAGYGALATDQRREITRLGGRLLAHDLAALGINADCVPVLDVPVEGAHDVVGDRAYGRTPETVATLGRAACEGLLAGGVLPIVKHIPGHGRATADSHLDLPVVHTPYEELDAWDFAPFRMLSDMPMAMTAHVVYSAVDAKRPAPTSERSLAAGCDVILHCNGDMAEMQAVMEGTGKLSGKAKRRAEAALSRIVTTAEPFDPEEGRARFDAAFDGRYAA
jgi:beta-N-acetylhexosaminidase